MKYSDDLTLLLEREQFWRFVETIHSQREYWVASLADADTTEKLHQVSGKIQALDAVLAASGWEIAKKKLQMTLL